MKLDALNYILVAALVVSALGTVMAARLLMAALGLAITSAVLSIILFRFDAPLAAVFELSVCAGLIPAIFISAIGMTRRMSDEDLAERQKRRFRKLWFLPVLTILIGVALTRVHVALDFPMPGATAVKDVREVLWNLRHVDLVGQVVILMGGAFAVVVLVKELKHE